MSHQLRFAALLFAVLGAAACSMVTPEQRSAACRATDWHSYGLNDGTLGVPMAQRDKKFADCAALGYPADIATYRAARAEGLKLYCTVENGYQVGYAGRRYRNVCPPELEQSFLQGYEQGRKERPMRDYYPYFGFGGFYYPYSSIYRYPYYYPHRFNGHR